MVFTGTIVQLRFGQGRQGSMFRVRLIVSIASVAIAAALAGCSGSSMSMPDWMSFSKSPPPLATMQFEFDSAGRRRAHLARPDLPNPLRAGHSTGIPGGFVHQDRLSPAIGADHRRAAAGSFALREPAADVDPQSSGCHAAIGEPATPAAAAAETEIAQGFGHRPPGCPTCGTAVTIPAPAAAIVFTRLRIA